MMQRSGLQGAPVLDLKRARLSPSPATGLVGMEENIFLASFFDCLGFLPLTNERLVHGAVMEVILGAESTEHDEDGPCPTPARMTHTHTWGGQMTQQGGLDAASACMLWCTVAMGALVQGQPPERVARYASLARVSLSQCFDVFTVETARAFTVMAYLHNFLRDDDTFCRHLWLARVVVDRLPETTPQKREIMELLARADDTRIFHTTATTSCELDAYCTDNDPTLEVPACIEKNALRTLLFQMNRRLIKAYLRDHKTQAVVPPDIRNGQALSFSSASSGGREPGAAEQSHTAGIQAQVYQGFADQGIFDGWRGTSGAGGEGPAIAATTGDVEAFMSPTTMDDETDPTTLGGETLECTLEARRVFAHLKEVGSTPGMAVGVGGLMYNAISVYLDIVMGQGELEPGFEKTRRCAKILVRYPGLCRFSQWLHLSHCLLSILAELEEATPYEELRRAYNSVLTEDALEAPAHGEWKMIGFCGHIFCRSMDHLQIRETGSGARQPGIDPGVPGQTAEDGDTDSNGVANNFKEQAWRHAEGSDWAYRTSQDQLHMSTPIPDQLWPYQNNEWSDLICTEGGALTLSWG